MLPFLRTIAEESAPAPGGLRRHSVGAVWDQAPSADGEAWRAQGKHLHSSGVQMHTRSAAALLTVLCRSDSDAASPPNYRDRNARWSGQCRAAQEPRTPA